MVTYDSEKRHRVRTVIKDCVEDLEARIERVHGYKSLADSEKSAVYQVINRAKKTLLDGGNDLMVEFQPTEGQ